MNLDDELEELRRHYPDDDPFLQEALVIDDAIDDVNYNPSFLDLDAVAAAIELRRLRGLRDAYEIKLLTRWWNL
jgi:hypothetical protein